MQGISWSTSSVLSESMSQAASIGLNVAPRSTLPVLRDIDTIEVKTVAEYSQRQVAQSGIFLGFLYARTVSLLPLALATCCCNAVINCSLP